MKFLRLMPALALLGAVGCGTNPNGSAPSSPATPRVDSALATDHSDDDATPLRPGAVFTLSNSPSGNEVLAWTRDMDGTLSGPTATATGGLGTGAGLGNQGALVFDSGRRFLFAVNAGSDEISVLRVAGAQLQFLGSTPSGGSTPISLTVHGRTLYVLNAGGAGNIAGFRVGPSGSLTPIPHSIRRLGSAAPGPAQIGFSPDGDALVVTEKGTNSLSTYRVDDDGRAIGPRVNPSSGQTPFGFAFTNRGVLVVSEAFGGGGGQAAVSSYNLRRAALRVVSGSVPTLQTAACWIAITDNGRFAYSTNTGTNNLTGFAVGRFGRLDRLDDDGVTAPADGAPTDAAFSAGSRYLYVLNSSAHTLTAYSRGAGGSLASLPGVGGLPVGTNGLAAY